MIQREDMILNSMYGRLAKDMQIFRMMNERWFFEHRGCSVYMFFVPCRKPILTEYMSGTNYIIDRIVLPDGTLLSEEETEEFCHLNSSEKFGIRRLRPLKKFDGADCDLFASRIKSGETDWIDDFIDFSSSEIFAAGVPEGYIFRLGRKYVMQYVCEMQDGYGAKARVGSNEKSQFEFFLSDFASYWDSDESIEHNLVSNDYVKSVCNLFNGYITNREKPAHKIENNITETSLEPPCVGERFDIGYEYIPDATTKALCAEKTLYANIFKVLLANLRRKKNKDHTIFMNREKVEKWNEIVTTIGNMC
jgi:hypothetical protein